VSSASGEEHINGSSVALSPAAVEERTEIVEARTVEPSAAPPAEAAGTPAADETEPAPRSEPPAEPAPAKPAKAKANPVKANPVKANPVKADPAKGKAVKAKPAKPVEAPPDDEDEVVKRDAWRRVLAVAVVLVASLAVVVLWARPAHEPAAPPLETAPASQLNPTDLAYLQLMISLDSSALPLFDLMKDIPSLQGVAGSGADGHRAELVALRAALAAGAGVEDSSIHAGHDLPGMVLDADLATVRDAPADQRAAKAAAALRDHLGGTIPLATSEGKAGSDPATLAIARQVADAHSRLLAALPAA
jgi:hypothetical protein